MRGNKKKDQVGKVWVVLEGCTGIGGEPEPLCAFTSNEDAEASIATFPKNRQWTYGIEELPLHRKPYDFSQDVDLEDDTEDTDDSDYQDDETLGWYGDDSDAIAECLQGYAKGQADSLAQKAAELELAQADAHRKRAATDLDTHNETVSEIYGYADYVAALVPDPVMGVTVDATKVSEAWTKAEAFARALKAAEAPVKPVCCEDFT
jgi:hypothetical protein